MRFGSGQAAATSAGISGSVRRPFPSRSPFAKATVEIVAPALADARLSIVVDFAFFQFATITPRNGGSGSAGLKVRIPFALKTTVLSLPSPFSSIWSPGLNASTGAPLRNASESSADPLAPAIAQADGKFASFASPSVLPASCPSSSCAFLRSVYVRQGFVVLPM